MMNLRRTGFVIACVISFLVLMPRGTAGRWRTEEGLFLPLGGHSVMAPPEIEEDMMEQIWVNCRLALVEIKEVVKKSDSSLLEDIISDFTELNLKTRLFAKGSEQEAISLLSPEMKHAFFDCLSKQNLKFSVSGKHSLRSWYADYLEPLLGWHPSSRRHLADQPSQTIAPASAPTPAHVSFPAPDLAPATSPGRKTSPAPLPDQALASSPVPDVKSPAVPPSSTFLQESNDPSPNSAPVLPPNKQNSSKRSVVIAIVVTASVTSLLAAFIFYCYYRCCRNKNDADYAQRDDRPLLALSLSNFTDSSHKSFGLDNSIDKDKFGALSFKTDPSQIGRISSVDISSVESPPYGAFSGISSSSSEPSNAPSSASAPKPPPPPPPVMPPSVKKTAAPPPAPPPAPPNLKPGTRPPPPPKGPFPPPRPPQANSSSSKVIPPSPLGPNHHSGDAASDHELGTNAPKAKLKPFFWDKVLAKPDHSMVWDQIKSGSFQFNEEMIESLFGYSSADKRKSEGQKESSSNDPSTQYIRILDPKKSHYLAIPLKALNIKIEEVCDALMEGNELPTELLQTLLRMAPTTDEELKLRLYSGNPALLGPVEQFLKALVDIPFAFKRLDALLFMASLQEDVSSIKESLATLEVACKELRSSRLFFKLLEAVLKTGNRMNDGTFRGGAQAFKLDTLLKLADVKGTDGKTTLLHFVVREIIRSEGVRAARVARESGSISSLTLSSLNSDDLTDDSPPKTGDHYRNLGLQVVSGLGDELENVKKAASLDADGIANMVATLGHRLVKTREFLKVDMRSLEEESGFHRSLKSFVEHVEADIISLVDEEKRIRSLVKSTTDYFHGTAGKDEGLHVFVIVRDFLGVLDKACKEVRESPSKVPKTPNHRDAPTVPPVADPRHLLFPAIRDRRVDGSSSDDEGR